MSTKFFEDNTYKILFTNEKDNDVSHKIEVFQKNIFYKIYFLTYTWGFKIKINNIFVDILFYILSP